MVTEYFSGLNREEAEKLINKTVEYSYHGLEWSTGILLAINPSGTPFRVDARCPHYIRTCLHPNATISGVKLPMPEKEEPIYNTAYWTFDLNGTGKINRHIWKHDYYDRRWLSYRIIHLTRDRAQAWANWWEKHIIGEMG